MPENTTTSPDSETTRVLLSPPELDLIDVAIDAALDIADQLTASDRQRLAECLEVASGDRRTYLEIETRANNVRIMYGREAIRLAFALGITAAEWAPRGNLAWIEEAFRRAYPAELALVLDWRVPR